MKIETLLPELIVVKYLSLYENQRFIHARDLLRELVIRSIKIRYKGSLLGIAWSVIYSLVQLLVFHLIFHSVLGSGITNYPSYVFIGLLAWNWFQTSLLQGVGTFVANRELLRKPGFPVAVLPITTVITQFIDFLLGLPVLLIFLFVAGVDININFVILPIIIFIQFAFTLTLIYFFAALQINFRDTQHFLTTILRLGFFLTPIFYDISIVPEKYQDFYHLNPLVHILSSYRSLLLEGNFSGSLPLLFITILTIICFPFAYKRFQSARYRCLEEV